MIFEETVHTAILWGGDLQIDLQIVKMWVIPLDCVQFWFFWFVEA